ncbi:efflux RND transporter periplasmic adaptor subunit [Ancylomarina sp.]|uniref:efflux RND transporter periplasmic adaptor subunit n=1 Tax=Ancylomarina sp. TaxID=1970196 RepID=UPI003567982F
MTIFSKQTITILSISLLTFTISSCHSKQNDIYTHQIEYRDYTDHLIVVGELQPSNTLNISCPRLRADASISYLIKHGKWVEKGDTICILEAKEIANKYEQANSDLDNAKAEYRKTEAQLNLNTQLLIAQKETIEASEAIKKLDSIQQKFVSNSRKQIIGLELKKAELEKQKVVNRLNSLKNINKSILSQKKIKIKQAEIQLSSAKSLLDQLIIKAPISGTILRAKQRRSNKLINEGDIVWGGMAIAKIPNTASYQVKLSLTEQECKQIEKDFPFKGKSKPNEIISGFIKNKAPVGKPIEENSEVKIFDIIAKIDSINFEPKPGQSVFCNIITKTIPDAYIIPLLSVFPEDSIQVVYVAQQDKFEKRSITIVYKNAIQAIVTSGFKAEEKVALIKPHKNQILKKDTSDE